MLLPLYLDATGHYLETQFANVTVPNLTSLKLQRCLIPFQSTEIFSKNKNERELNYCYADV